MKKFLLLILVMTIAGTATQAQIRREKKTYVADSTKPAANPEQENEKMKRKEMMQQLNLTREQQKQMKDFMQGMKAKRDTIEADTLLSKQDRQMKMKALRQEQADNMQKILTPEQFEKWKELRKDGMKQNMKKEDPPVNQ